MTEHIKTKKYIKEIPDIKTFEELLNRSTLSSEDKDFMHLRYIEDKDFMYIGDVFGYTEKTAIKKHNKILAKLAKLI